MRECLILLPFKMASSFPEGRETWQLKKVCFLLESHVFFLLLGTKYFYS